MTEVVREQVRTLLAVAQTGLQYGRDSFDLERYRQIREAATVLLSLVANQPLGALRRDVEANVGYATPKVDVRGAVFDEFGRILLTQERSDCQWTLPGGWCDVGEPASVAVSRELREESGYSARPVRLGAVLDRELHGHTPPMAVHVYKMFFLCELDGEDRIQPLPNETLDVGWFSIADLPPLSLSRVTEPQLRLLLHLHQNPTMATVFD